MRWCAGPRRARPGPPPHTAGAPHSSAAPDATTSGTDLQTHLWPHPPHALCQCHAGATCQPWRSVTSDPARHSSLLTRQHSSAYDRRSLTLSRAAAWMMRTARKLPQACLGLASAGMLQDCLCSSALGKMEAMACWKRGLASEVGAHTCASTVEADGKGRVHV